MLRVFECVLKVQKYNSMSIYYPLVKNFQVIDSIPFQNSSEASIYVISNSTLNDIQTASLVEYDDIVRLQVALKNNEYEYSKYATLFEGRVQNIDRSHSEDQNVVELACVGHINAAFETLETFSHTWTNVDAKTAISTLMAEGHKLSRLEYNADLVQTGVVMEDYAVTAGERFFSEILQEFETLSAQQYFVDTKQTYYKNGALEHCYLTWQPLPTTPTTKYKIIEGSHRLIDAAVTVVGEDVKTYRYVVGGTDSTSGYTYHGDAADSLAVSRYGPRYGVDRYSWVMSDALAIKVSQGLVADSKEPYVSIQVTLEGTPDAHKGDLVTVDFRTLNIKGVTISGNYKVSKVQQKFDETGGFTTTLDLGRTRLNEYEYQRKYLAQQLKACVENIRKA